MPQKDLTTLADLQDASRGEGTHASDAPATCYLIHDGTYVQSGSTLPLYLKVGGTDATHRRVFVGQSRDGVKIKGRASIDAGVSHVRVSNLSFDLTGYSQTGSFNTFSMLENSTDLRLDHLSFTGDCATGANGGHVEVAGSTDVVIEACLIEKFGRCNVAEGRQDHGVYLANGSQIVVRNNEIRGNASRGVQLNTNNGDFGTLDHVTIELNRIHHNGHADYEDGIVMNATGTGTISDVVVRRNLLYQNYYSGLRQVGTVFSAISVTDNTFYENGAGSSAAGRSEANLDDVGSGANTTYSRNIFVAGNKVLNDCYDATPRAYVISDNLTQGTVPSGTSGSCVTGSVSGDPMFTNAANADFHSSSAYGAYAP